MGKKGDKKRKLAQSDDEEDPELESEIAAVLAMRAEKDGKIDMVRKSARTSAISRDSMDNDDSDDFDGEGDDDEDTVQVGYSAVQNRTSMNKIMYNKDGLKECLEGVSSHSLPFIESMVVNEFDVDVQDEHDDLQREVSQHQIQQRFKSNSNSFYIQLSDGFLQSNASSSQSRAREIRKTRRHHSPPN